MRLLQDALVALILEKGYGAVTVQDILDRANLGRSTFYAHYQSKDDLLYSRLESLHEALEAHNPGGDAGGNSLDAEGMDLTLTFFQYAARDHRLFKALLGKEGGNALLKETHQQLSIQIGQHLKRLAPDENNIPVRLDALVHYLVSAFLALLVWWLDNDLPYSAEQMNEIFKQLTMPGFMGVLGLAGDV